MWDHHCLRRAGRIEDLAILRVAQTQPLHAVDLHTERGLGPRREVGREPRVDPERHAARTG